MPENKKSVTIVGLLPRQVNRIQENFGKALDLKFFHTDVLPSQILSVASSTDIVILMTKFINHEVQRTLRKHKGLTHCNGSVSALESQLADISSF